MARVSPSLVFVSCFVFASLQFFAYEAQAQPPVAKGLSFSFFSKTCPKLESIVRNHLTNVFKQDDGQAPGLVRIFFHDCFVQGCDGSILLDNPNGERQQGANIGIRTEALQTIENIRALVHKECGPIVSCADITVLAARDAVFLSGGPDFKVPLGRKDGTTFNAAGTGKLPSPFGSAAAAIKAFTDRKVFDVTDVVALSGAHTFGRAHCPTFFSRASPTVDPTMDTSLANKIKATCPSGNSMNTFNLDIKTPKLFDNQYYVDLLNRQGLFTSDQDLMSNTRTQGLVNAFAQDQPSFFKAFANAMVKLSQLDVLTGNQGEIRNKCNVVNKKPSLLASVVDGIPDFTQF